METSAPNMVYGVPAYGPAPAMVEGAYGPKTQETLNLQSLFRVIRRRIVFITVVTVLGTALAAALALGMEHQYRTNARILIAKPETEIMATDQNNGDFLITDQNFIDTQVQVIASDVVLRNVIRDLDLLRHPEFNPDGPPSGFLQYMMSLDWIGDLRALAQGPDDGAGLDGADVLERKVLETLRKRIDVTRADLTYIIDVTAISKSPKLAQQLANAVASQYLETQLTNKFEATDRATDLLDKRLQELRADLVSKERAIEEYRAENDLGAVGESSLDEQLLSDLNRQLAQTRADIAEKEARLRLVQNLVRSRANAESIGEVLDSAVIIGLRTQQAAIIRRRAELSSRYKPTHPDMVQVTRELEDLEAQIRREVDLIVKSLENEVDVSRERERSLAETLDEYTNKYQAEKSSKATSISRLKDLERDAEATRSIYQTFLARSKEVTELKESDQVDARILSEASVPIEPFKPKRTVIVLAGAVLAGIFAFAGALAMEALAPGIRTPEDMENILGLPHLASVPQISGGDSQRPFRYMLQHPLSGFSEAYRTLLATVTLADRERTRHVVLFTSALPAEGKTTNAMCFALASAKSGKRTVLIEADLRMPKVGWQLDLPFEHSLTEVLNGEVSLGAAMLREPETGLAVLAMRRAAPDPGSLLGSNAFQELLSTLKEHFDVIILDTAPILPVGDTLQLAPLADHVVFVVRARKTARGDVAMALKELRAVQSNILGGVVTFADTSNRRAYGYGNYGQTAGAAGGGSGLWGNRSDQA
ncbi:MAG: GumC family protein [Alphaproteobacteria bacterium]